MSLTHYKLPLDEQFDKDIIDWINKFSRNKKGEMVRHAVRYYMEQSGEGESIKFPQQFIPISMDSLRTEEKTIEKETVEEEEKFVGLNFKALKEAKN